MKRIFCIAMIAGLMLSLAACGNNKPTEQVSPETVAPSVVQTEAPTMAEQTTPAPTVAPTVSVKPNAKGFTKMGDYLNDPTVKEAYDAIVENGGDMYKNVKVYAVDDSTVAFEYVFNNAFDGAQLDGMKERFKQQESTLFTGAKSTINEIERETSIESPKAEFKYVDADGNVLYDRVFTSDEVKD